MAFSVESAKQYIQSKVQEVYRQGPVLKNQLIEISQIIGKLKKMPPAAVQTKLRNAENLRRQIGIAIGKQTELEAEVYPFARFFGVDRSLAGNELGAFPILLAGAAIMVAGLIYNQFQRIQNNRRALDLIGKGVLTPEQAKRLKQSPGWFGGIGEALGGMQTLLIVGIGVTVFFFAFGTGKTREG